MIDQIWKRWEKFFFAPKPTLPVAGFRVMFAATALVMYTIRFLDWRFYFTDQGMIPGREALEVLPEFFRPAFGWYPEGEFAVVALQLVFLGMLLALLLGVFSRISALIAFVLHLAFLQRNFAIIYGADIVATFFLFALIFADSGARLSVLHKRRDLSRPLDPLASIGLRLVQIQLSIIYGYSGMEKLKGASWWDGTAIWAVLGNQQLMMFDLSFFRHVPLLIAFLTFSTMLWEIYFPILIWCKTFRGSMLAFGVCIHLGIALTVGLWFFSLVMISAYFVFMNPEHLQTWITYLTPRRRRSSSLQVNL